MMFDSELVATSRTTHTQVMIPVPIVRIDTYLGDHTLTVGVVETGRPFEVVELQDPPKEVAAKPLFNKRQLHATYTIHVPRLQRSGRVTPPQEIAVRLPQGPWIARHRGAAVMLEPGRDPGPRRGNGAARVDDRGRLLLGAGLRDVAGFQEGAPLVMLMHRDRASLILVSVDTFCIAWANTMFEAEEQQ